MQGKTLFRIAALSGVLAVMLGAFGAHGLKPLINEASLQTWQTASFYHFVHTLVLLVLAFSAQNHKIPRCIPILFIVGMCLFSGSLYLLSTKELHPCPQGILGPLTPIGGVIFILGWISLITQSSKFYNMPS